MKKILNLHANEYMQLIETQRHEKQTILAESGGTFSLPLFF